MSYDDEIPFYRSRVKLKREIVTMGVEDLDPPTAVVSFVLPPESEINADIVNSFCHYVHFFADEHVAAEWAREHEGAFIVSVDDAFQAARAKNQWQYPLGLEKRNR